MQIKSILKYRWFSESGLYALAQISLIAYCLCFSLSIAISQISIIAFMVFVGGAVVRGGWNKVASPFLQVPYVKDYYVPLLFWLLICTIGLPVSLNPLRSVLYLLKFSVYLFLPLALCIFLHRSKRKGFVLEEIKKYILLIFFAQGLAAVHTVISTYLGYEIRPKIPGDLTESGQIVLLLPLVVGTVYTYTRDRVHLDGRRLLFHVFFVLFPVMFFAWYRRIPFVSKYIGIICGIVALLYVFAFVVKFLKEKESRTFISLLERMLPFLGILIFAAFLLNLKRGPWFAGVIEIMIFGLLFSRSLMVGLLVLMLLFSLTPPVYERIASFAEHFFIGGGRFDMWKLGLQMIERFPMGIGFANSSLMREFDPSLPLTHRHMHNNILNVTLETGILGALVYVWWFLGFIYKGFSSIIARYEAFTKVSQEGFYVCVLLLSIIGWQLAGIVEYNFGDGEIRLLAFVLIGFLIAIVSSFHKNSSEHF